MNGSQILSMYWTSGSLLALSTEQVSPWYGRHLVDDGRRGGDQVDAELPLQALLDDLHMQQAEKAAAEAETQRHGVFRLEGEGSIVQAQLFQRIAQGVVIHC